MRRCTLFGFKWPVHNHVLVNGLFPWKGERGQVLYLTYVWLKKRPVFSSKCFNIFANGIWWCLGIDLIKTVSLSLQRSWSFLAYCMGYFSSLFLLIKGGYILLLFWFGFSGLTQICVVSQTDITVKPGCTDTRLIRTPHYYGHFTFSLGKESLYIFSSNCLIRTLR